jgi:hypothetical protein
MKTNEARLVHASVVLFVAGRLQSAVGGSATRVAVVTNGIRSTPEECAPSACISGKRRNVYGVIASRRILIGMPMTEGRRWGKCG